MSFGVGVGDIIAIVSLANKIRKDFVGAPKQLSDISDEVRNLSIILQDIDVVLADYELDDGEMSNIQSIIASCKNVLTDLESVVHKYTDLDSGHRSVRQGLKRAWKRLEWEPEEIRDLRGRIASNVAAFNTVMIRKTSQSALSAQKGTERLNQKQDDQERLAILDWLTPIDFAPQQHDFISRRQPGTGQWLLDSEKYQTWLTNPHQTLFCPGMPGAGKTIISAVIIDDLIYRYRSDSSVGIAYIYLNFRRGDEQTTENLLASLAKQLGQDQPSLPQCVRDLYERHQKKKGRPSLDELLSILSTICSSFARVFVVVDAVDECRTIGGNRERFISELFDIQRRTKLNILATSRDIPEINEKFASEATLEILADKEDIKRYVAGRMPELPGYVMRNTGLQQEVQIGILNAVSGMFLLAQLHFDSLIGKRSPKAMRAALQGLASGSREYDQAYQDAMNRIHGQVADRKILAEHVLLWIVHAERPLETSELQHALAVEEDCDDLDEDNIPDLEDLVSACAGLVTIDHESDIIRLVHYTTQEYFERTKSHWFPHAQTLIGTHCTTYLSFQAFETGICQTVEGLTIRLQKYPFYAYASLYWGYHVQPDLSEVKELVLQFLRHDAKVEASGQAMIACGNRRKFYSLSHGITCTHLAAFFGLEELLASLLDKGYPPHAYDTRRKTPLIMAASEGHEAVVELLLSTEEVKTNLRDGGRYGALNVAAAKGHETVVSLLLEKDVVIPDLSKNGYLSSLIQAVRSGHLGIVKQIANTNRVSLEGSFDETTPLYYAVMDGHDDIVRYLLNTDTIDQSLGDTERAGGQMLMVEAASHGHLEVLKLLVDHGLDVESRPEPEYRPIRFENETPLLAAVGKGQDQIVKYLLEKGARVNTRSSLGLTPVSVAAADGNEPTLRILLENGGDRDPPDDDDEDLTPLMWAVTSGEEAVVRCLLDRGSNVRFTSGSGATPLSLAAEYGHATIVRLLLDNGVIVDSVDRNRRTPLSLAAQGGHAAVVQLLLSTDGVDPDWKDDGGRAPLSYAAENGHMEVVKALLSIEGVDVDWLDYDGRTALIHAAQGNRTDMVKFLIAMGSDPNSEDHKGFRAITFAMWNDDMAMMRFLCSVEGIDLLFRDKDGLTMLSYAAVHELRGAVKELLLGGQFEINAQDKSGMTALSYAARQAETSIIKMLANTEGIDFDIRNVTGQTPLHYAAACRRKTWDWESNAELNVQMLLATGKVDINARDSNGWTPLMGAVDEGNEDIVKILLEQGADVDIREDTGDQTALDIAIRRSHGDLIAINEAYRGSHEAITQVLSKHQKSN